MDNTTYSYGSKYREERERADLGVCKQGRDARVEVGQFLVLVAPEDENLVLEEWWEPSEEPHPEIF